MLHVHLVNAARILDAAPIDRLFVYGTLKRGEPNAALVVGARTVEAATVEGRLYALAEGYPALILAIPGTAIHGELLHFDDLASLLPSLDAFEGADSLFQRVIVRTAPSGLEAFAYVMPRARESGLIARGARAVSDGRWSARSHALIENE